MGRLQSPCDLDGHVEHRLDARHPALPDPGIQRSAFHVLGEDDHFVAHGAEEPAGDQVGMGGQIDPASQLLEEFLAVVQVLDQVRPDPLDRVGLAGAAAAGQVDVAHPARAQVLLHKIIVQEHQPRRPRRRSLDARGRGGRARRKRPGRRLSAQWDRPAGTGPRRVRGRGGDHGPAPRAMKLAASVFGFRRKLDLAAWAVKERHRLTLSRGCVPWRRPVVREALPAGLHLILSYAAAGPHASLSGFPRKSTWCAGRRGWRPW